MLIAMGMSNVVHATNSITGKIWMEGIIYQENIQQQCKGCNGWGDASVGHEYYLYMVEMYGENAVRQLTAEKHKTKKHNRTELEELKIHYKKLIADLEKEL